MSNDLFHPLNVSTVWEELSLEGLSECSVWRMNLLASSRKDSSMFFIAVRDQVHCYRFAHPHDPSPELIHELVVESGAGILINAMKIGMIGNEEVLVAVNDAGGVYCWFTEMFERHPLIFENASSTWGITTHNEMRLLAVSANNHNVTVYNLQYSIQQTEDKSMNDQESEKASSVNSPLDGCEKRVLIGHSNNIPDIDFSPCGWYLASVSIDSSCRVWSVNSGEVVWQKTLGTDWGWSVQFVSPADFKGLPLSDVKKEHTDSKYPTMKVVQDVPDTVHPLVRIAEAIRARISPNEVSTLQEHENSADESIEAYHDEGDEWFTEDDENNESDEDNESSSSGEVLEPLYDDDDDNDEEDEDENENENEDEDEDEDEDEEEDEESSHEQGIVNRSGAAAQQEEQTGQHRAANNAEQTASDREETTDSQQNSNAASGEGWGSEAIPLFPGAFLPHFMNLNNDEYLADYDEDGMDEFYDDYAYESGVDEDDYDDEFMAEYLPNPWHETRSWDLDIGSIDGDDDGDTHQDASDVHRDRRRRGSYPELTKSASRRCSGDSSSQGDYGNRGSEIFDVDEGNATATARHDVPTSPAIITKAIATKPRAIDEPDVQRTSPMSVPLILCTTLHDLILLEPESWPPRLAYPTTCNGYEGGERKESNDSLSDGKTNRGKISRNDKQRPPDGEKWPGNLVTVARERRLVSRYDQRIRRNIAPFERLNMVEWIPELSLAIVASQKGYAALVRLIRVYPDRSRPVGDKESRDSSKTAKGTNEGGGYIMHVESYLPMDEPPPAPLLGLFVSVHDEPSNGFNCALTSSALSFYRVCMIYYDRSMNIYEIRKDPKRLGRFAVEVVVM